MSSNPVPPPNRIPAAANAAGDGIVIGAGPIEVEAYEDFLCPYCRAFEQRDGMALAEMVAEGAISLVYHPLGFLDGLSTTAYSSRAAAASGCAADGGRFAEFKDALFANQPPEGGPGLADAQLVTLALEVGLDEGFERCVAAAPYLDWVAYVTARAVERGIDGTPTVLVAGTMADADAASIAAAVRALATAG